LATVVLLKYPVIPASTRSALVVSLMLVITVVWALSEVRKPTLRMTKLNA